MFGKDKILRRIITEFPQSCGVYIMKDENGDILYVGKARNLKKRVLSYFSSSVDDKKVLALRSNLFDISYIATDTEIDALLLEESLIKKFKPKYNIALRDDKSYPFLRIEGGDKELIRVSIVREKDIQEKDEVRFFGPYPNVKLLRLSIKGLRFVYPFRSCGSLKKKCVYGTIGLCAAPCVKEVSVKEIRRIREGILKVLRGDIGEVVDILFSRMNELSLRMDFESAAFLRDSALAIHMVFGKGVGKYFGLLAVYDLKDLLDLDFLPRRIEGIDISNIFGEYAVGSLVSFWDGKPDKKNYRRYKIKCVKGINDVEMIYEVAKRRCRKIREFDLDAPDIILADGGKAQLNAVRRAVMEMGLDIYVISLAKKEELVFVPGKKDGIRLDEMSSGLNLLKFIRDEAHRFALSYHKLRRKKGLGL